ncbi:MAG: glycosyltransferase family 2 protein [Actinomycetota bacterium]
MQRVSVTVVVPTYGRPELLARCLEAVVAQDPAADEVVVVHRPEDEATATFLDMWTSEDRERRRAVRVERPGIVPALLAGTEAARCDVVAYMDDDAIPRPGWLAEVQQGFADATVGAIGGRIVDHVDGRLVTGRTERVGAITWYGRIIWAHTLETDYRGPVGFLAGANMTIRRELANFDRRLKHTHNGHAMANDIDVCLGVWRAGKRVLYTPASEVEHYTTSFRDPSLGSRVWGEGVTVAAANHTYAVLKHVSLPRRIALRVYAYLIGSSTTPGPVRAAAELARSPRWGLAMVRRIGPAWRGRRLAARMYREYRGGEPA